ncbi:F-box-like domain-containing protein [Candidatus Protochlamydia phocaeensis]|uniref:F-box-like domain-containing protein n=1 Tax=Candidatus Protochlamydia phocaeensis TaxID=1414722 RepID=UPI0008396630|nr:F-box protein [Candidatus Protochlamydia phocaeensis]
MSLISISHFAEYNHFSSPLKVYNPTSSITLEYVSSLLEFHGLVQQTFEDYFQREKPSLAQWERFKNDYLIREEGSTTTIKVKSTNIEMRDKRQKQIILAVTSLYRHLLKQSAVLNQTESPSFASLKEAGTECKEEEKAPIHYLNYLAPLDFSSSNPKPGPIQILPNEILDHIFSFVIKSWQDMGRISLTCKNFAYITLDPGCLKRYFQQSPAFYQISRPDLSRRLLDYTHFHPTQLNPRQTDLSDKDLAIIANQGSQLSNLILQGGSFTVEGLKNLLQNCPELQTIEFHRCHLDHIDECISILGLYAPQLKHLRVIDCPMTDQSLLALAACKLQLLSFEYWNSLSQGTLTDYGLIPFFDSLPYLETVKLTGCLHATENALLALIEKPIPPTLEKKGSRLKEVGFSYCGYAGQALLESLADNCLKLEKLTLGFAPSLCTTNLLQKKQGLVRIFQDCNQLSSISLSDCRYLDEEAFKLLTLTPTASSLKELELYRCIRLTPIFTQNLRNWTHLNTFKYQPFKPKDTVETPPLLKATPLLSELAHLNLQTLSLVDCPILMDCPKKENSLNSYLEKKGSSLKHFELKGCGSFGASLLDKLGENCQNLENLELLISPSTNPFDDKSLEKLVKGCPALRTLQLKSPSRNSCGSFSHQALNILAKGSPQLCHLTLEGFLLAPSKAFNNQSSESTEPKPEILGQESEIHRSLKAFTRRCIHLTHLGLPKNQLNATDALLLLNAFSAEMRSLDIDQTSWSHQEKVIDAITQCKRLQNLQLCSTLITQEQLKHAIDALPHLQYLEIRNGEHLQLDSSPPSFFPPSLFVKK